MISKIINIHLIKEIYCQFREYRNIFEEINLEGLITIRIKDEQRPTSLEI